MPELHALFYDGSPGFQPLSLPTSSGRSLVYNVAMDTNDFAGPEARAERQWEGLGPGQEA
jgi:hypothetical protein